MKDVVSITTDGVPSMMSLHYPSLCSALLEEYEEVMNTGMKLINFLRASSSHKHCLLREFLTEVDANSNDLLLHCNVRWLSKGRVLARVWAIRNEIKMFLEQQKNHKARQFAHFLEDERKKRFYGLLS